MCAGLTCYEDRAEGLYRKDFAEHCTPPQGLGACTVDDARAKLLWADDDLALGAYDDARATALWSDARDAGTGEVAASTCYACYRQRYNPGGTCARRCEEDSEVEAALKQCYPEETYSCTADDWTHLVDAAPDNDGSTFFDAEEFIEDVFLTPSDSCAICMAISSGHKMDHTDFKENNGNDGSESGFYDGCALAPPRCSSDVQVDAYFTALDECLAAAPQEEVIATRREDGQALMDCVAAIALPANDQCSTYCIGGINKLIPESLNFLSVQRVRFERISDWCDPAKTTSPSPGETTASASQASGGNDVQNPGHAKASGSSSSVFGMALIVSAGVAVAM